MNIIDADENNAEAHYHAAYSQFMLGDLDEAIEKFKKQTALVPYKYYPCDILGEAYRKKGMLKEALDECKKQSQ